jgi:hypothetical protein
MNLANLVKARRQAFERFEAAKANEASDSPDDRMAFLAAQKEYQDAEAELQRAMSLFTTQELAEQGIGA